MTGHAKADRSDRSIRAGEGRGARPADLGPYGCKGAARGKSIVAHGAIQRNGGGSGIDLNHSCRGHRGAFPLGYVRKLCAFKACPIPVDLP